MKEQKEQFEFKLIDKFPGYNSASDKTNLPHGTMIRGSKNVYKTLRGTLATRPGLKRRGTVDTTEAPVKAEFVFNTNVGTTRPLRVCNNKLQVESNIANGTTLVWYDLLETSTLAHPAVTLTRFVFDTWWDDEEKTDRLIMTRGDFNVLSWSGGMALVDSGTATTITKQGVETWAELGFATSMAAEKKIIIGGVEYTYTGGEGTTTLTGVTPTAVGLVSGDVVIQSVMVNDVPDVDNDGYDFDFVKVINNQAMYGSYSSRIIYISAAITSGGVLGFLNVVDTTSHVSGDPDFLVLDNQAKGIGVQDGKVIIFAGENDMYIISLNQNVTYAYTGNDGLIRYNFQDIQKKQLSGLSAALGHEFIDNMNGNLVWIDQRNQLRAQGTFANIDNIIPTTLSLDVESELSEDDFTGGHLKVVGGTAYITAPNNARDWMYDIRQRIDENGQVISERLWQAPQIRGVSRFSVIDGVLYGHSNTNPQLYQIWDTNQWVDDDPSEEDMPYIPVIRLAYQNHGRRQGRVTFDTLYTEGYMPEGFDLKGTVYLDYRGSSGIRDISVSSDTNPAKFFTGANAPSLGDGSLGEDPLGDGILEEAGRQELLPKFRAMINIPQSKNFFEYGLEFFSVVADCRWELSVCGVNIRQASENAVFLKK